ncbi:MAG: zinc ribbon domain-containing protein [Clostridia bacterium]|nr:zinc ribbon domain-containing protein [Clostridia bacterium]
MGFKRATWHSGLTYQATCDGCKTVMRYTDYSLDFRPWFADGFVYCPQCKRPVRHSEHYAIDADGNYINPLPEKSAVPAQPAAPAPVAAPAQPAPEGGAVFCSNCGKQLRVGDNFCSGCGTKVV